jgi:hypothetical protein
MIFFEIGDILNFSYHNDWKQKYDTTFA